MGSPQPDQSTSASSTGDTTRSRPPLSRLEQAALVHAGVLLVFATWAFDGNVDWARRIISWWGCAGALITLAAVFRGNGGRVLRWSWPLLAFNLLVLASCLNPSFSMRTFDGESLLVHTGGVAWLPGSADPAASLRALWLFDGVFLPGLNLALCLRQRRGLRWLLILATGNALALSIFGTVQKLTGAGLFFGLRESPNAFFSPRSFITTTGEPLPFCPPRPAPGWFFIMPAGAKPATSGIRRLLAAPWASCLLPRLRRSVNRVPARC